MYDICQSIFYQMNNSQLATFRIISFMVSQQLSAKGLHILSAVYRSCIPYTHLTPWWRLHLSGSVPCRRLFSSWSYILAPGGRVLRCDVFIDLNIQRQKCSALSSCRKECVRRSDDDGFNNPLNLWWQMWQVLGSSSLQGQVKPSTHWIVDL